MKRLFLLSFAMLLSVVFFAQNANVQIIHNSPTPGTDAGPVVDIYVNGGLLPELTGVPYRAATAYLPVPADTDITVDIRVNPSTVADAAVFTADLGQLAEDANYVVIAHGVVGDATTPFNLAVTTGQQAAIDPTTVDLNIFHGATNAGDVNVDVLVEKDEIELLQDFAYATFTGYVALQPKTHVLNVYNDDADVTFWADLNGLAGGAGILFASGLIGDTPGFGLFAALPDGTVVAIPAIDENAFADVNIVHNSPSAGAETVDVYLNNIYYGELSFRQATGYDEFPAGDFGFQVGIAPAESASSDEVLVYFDLPTLEVDETYMVTVGGTLDDAAFPLELQIDANAQTESTDADAVAINVLHSSPGAPNVDVKARTVATLYEDVAYGTYTPYAEIPADFYVIDIHAAGSDDIVATYLANLGGTEGLAVTIMASGILGGEPAFGLYAIIDSDVVELPSAEISRVQIIHNSPEPSVDIYANDEILIPGLAFRDAIPYTFLNANQAFNIKVVPANGSLADAVYDEDVTFGENGSTLVVIATGVAGTDFTLEVNEGREKAESGSGVDVLVQHGSPDAPAVDVVANGVLTLIDDIEYKQFQGYANVPAADYELDVQLADNSASVAMYGADISGLDGGAAVIFASGYADGTTEPGFGLWVALADGTTFALPVITNTENIEGLNAWAISPNPARDFAQLNIDLTDATDLQATIYNMNGLAVIMQDLGQLTSGTQTITLDVSALPAGIYQVALQHETGRIARPLVITK